MSEVILVINSGSSSIKLAVYSYDPRLVLRYYGHIQSIAATTSLSITDSTTQQPIHHTSISAKHIKQGLLAFFAWMKGMPDAMQPVAVGHRVVHGGTHFYQPTLVTDDVMQLIAELVPLAPQHQADNLAAIKIIASLYPNIPQVACFDTSFHRTQNRLSSLFAIPNELSSAGFIRYGFHGLSYEYIAAVMPDYLGEISKQRVIVAHLGSGASMCAMLQQKSVATSMGMTALDGLMMGTRCGSIDPGLLLYMLQTKNYSVEQLSTLLYQHSGLLGVSGSSSDMRELQASTDPRAREAVDLFCMMAAKELLALCVVLQGLDALIFTAGIGEKSAIVRAKICAHLRWLGVIIDPQANARNAPIISQLSSKVVVSVIETNEAAMIAKHTLAHVVSQ